MTVAQFPSGDEGQSISLHGGTRSWSSPTGMRPAVSPGRLLSTLGMGMVNGKQCYSFAYQVPPCYMKMVQMWQDVSLTSMCVYDSGWCPHSCCWGTTETSHISVTKLFPEPSNRIISAHAFLYTWSLKLHWIFHEKKKRRLFCFHGENDNSYKCEKLYKERFFDWFYYLK